jgi:hypothetical protein
VPTVAETTPGTPAEDTLGLETLALSSPSSSTLAALPMTGAVDGEEGKQAVVYAVGGAVSECLGRLPINV